MEKEIWKSIKGYEGLYEISSLGNIRRLEGFVVSKNGSIKKVKARNLKTSENKSGYLHVGLTKNNKMKLCLVHRLVAEAFVTGKSEERHIVNHIDKNRTNPSADNLEWVTPSENTIHGLKLRESKKSKNKCKTKIPKNAKEIWKSIDGYENFYECSNFGRIRRLEVVFKGNDNKIYHTKSRELTPHLYKEKNYVVKLTKDGKSKIFYVHRLVAKLFLPNPENKPFVIHIDENVENNISFNLKWVSHSENYHNTYESNTEKIPSLDIDMSKEEWRDIKGYEGYFQVSNLGRVKSLSRTIIDKLGRKMFYKERIKDSRLNNSYPHVILNKNGLQKTFPIHRLVAEAFIPNDDYENKVFVNHINANIRDNRAENLEWVTPKGNSEHMSSLDRGKVKPVQQFDLLGNFIREFPSARRAAKECNIKYATLLNSLKRKQLNCGEFQWKWAEDETEMTPYKKPNTTGVLQYSMSGEYIQTFESITEAANYLYNNGYANANPANISKACTGIRNYSYDYQWRHEGDERPVKILKHRVNKIVQLSMDGLLIKTFDSIREAEIFLGLKINTSNISKCCNGKQKQAHGFKWKRYDDYIKTKTLT